MLTAPSPPRQAEPAGDPRRWVMLAVVVCATFMSSLDTFIVNIALPTIESALHASFAQMQLIVAGYTLAFAVLLVTGGRLGDLYGRKRLFLLGTSGFTLFSALCGVAPTASLLILFRIAQGGAAALLVPQVIAFIQVSFPASERPLAFSISAAVGGTASVVGQVIGAWLLVANLFNLGWRAIFLINVPIGIGALLASSALLRESRTTSLHRLDYSGAALLMLALTALIFPLVLGARTGWPLWSQISLALCLPFLLTFLLYEQRVTRQGRLPLISLALLRQRRFLAGLLTNLLANILFAGFLFLLAFYLQIVLRLSPLQASYVFLASSLSFISSSSLSPLFSSRLGKWSLSVAAFLVTLGYLFLLLAALWLVGQWGLLPLVVALCILGSGMGSLVIPLQPKVFAGIAHEDVGAASGMYTTATQAAAALGTAVIGLIFAAFTATYGSAQPAFVLSLLVLTLLSLVLSLTVLPLRS
ncbi:MFS transporter [Ktedonosporobacter rubrisoli]|uniref:MFS transporter n=1 Tax=Ktedonosporobacter rubrisoli TaxID=2509675 RepID=A0A4P6JP85_KTERU|nr:MFS transporter [Ktedonosporobacter rubrisoli]QBD76892.1 MFS transporter [Ktedonosporobacter rubrisoli]